ncbi:MAG: aminomethyl-transferring glycine dehydrogenase subunit GcvPA [Candidatus Latescibacteria bacterium]|nr:aminomethyl-transferring glycine dehydrogenase subunit GcvPA [Candidatus Latescibacterota bacterium]
MDYIPHTPAEIDAMCRELGIGTPEELFKVIPEALRIQGLRLPPPSTELEIWREMNRVNDQLLHDGPRLSFVGGGAYEHFIPSVVHEVVSRGEFYTAYTPYQPEVSQGTLQTIFEFQTMICELTGMEVANASMYDGASAFAEATLMALRIHQERRKIIVSQTVHPFYRSVVRTYLQGLDVELVEIPWGYGGTVDMTHLQEASMKDVAAVMVQQPNIFGCLEPVGHVGELLRETATVYVAAVNPISLGVLTPPGDYGTDIAVGDGQPLGIPISFGGPYVGFFASKMEYIRKMPGRIVGETVDVHGQRAYVMTLQTREQHIRRERATSNICTNQALCALMTTVYLAAMGPKGLEEVSQLNWEMSHRAAERLIRIPGVDLVFDSPFFNEFAIETPLPAAEVLAHLMTRGICGGIDLGRWYRGMERAILVCVTEMKTDEDIEAFAEALEGVL